jgi:transcription initiation factor TFIIE subunit alpha
VSFPFSSADRGGNIYRGLVYDQYYASLAASSQPTPVLETGGSDFGEEEEDVKPSIEYLNSLNEYRKRSRSMEDVGFATSNSGKKVVKLGYDNPGSGPIIASTTPMLEALVKEQPLGVEVPGQDPIVYGTLSFLMVLTLSFS